MIRILFLSANPIDRDHLRIRQERSEIQRALDSAKDGKRFNLIEAAAVNAGELQELLFRHKPQIVHFSGHGDESGELFFEDDDGESQPVAAQTLGNLFAKFKNIVRCVLLNACYSQEQANALAQHIDCLIGMNDAISDPAALSFAPAFYRALANATSLGDAFDLARNQLDLQGIDEAHKPQLLAERIDATQLRAIDWDEPDEAQLPPTSSTYNTDGGTTIGGDVKTEGDFVNRDKVEGDKVEGDKFDGNKTVIQQQNVYQYPPPAIRHSQLATPAIFGQYPFNENFFGRDDELAELHTLLQTQNTVSICPVITGMGGLGKTQLAAHYARRHTAEYSDGIFWVTAADLNAIRGQLADFCVALDLQVADPQRSGDLSEQKITAFKRYLDEHPKSLLIFDNVEEPDHLRTRQIGVQVTALTLGGKLIVTTRRRKVSSDRFVELPLQRLLPEPARQILLAARADLAQDPDLDRLCEQFGYLPLMLNLAAAALKKRGGAIAGYLQRLQTLGAEKLHNDVAKVSLDDYHKSLSAVLHEQWAMLNDENARLLFRVAGQLPEAGVIPTARLGLLAGLQDVDKWECPLSDALEELERASLIEQVDAATIRLHPLVRDFAERLTPTDEGIDFRTQCAQRLADTYTNEQTGMLHLGNEYAVRGIHELLADLIIALEFAQLKDDANQSLTIELKLILRILRLEASKLQSKDTERQPKQLWQQIVMSSSWLGMTHLVKQAIKHLQGSFYFILKWKSIYDSPSLEQTLVGHKSRVNAVAKLDEQYIISASNDSTLKIWNLITGEVERTFIDNTHAIRTLVVLDNNHVVTGSDDYLVKIWDISTGYSRPFSKSHSGWIYDIFKLDEKRIISSSDDNTIKTWNLDLGLVEMTFIGHNDAVLMTKAIPESDYIVTASLDRTLKIWDIKTGKIIRTLSGHSGGVWSVEILDKHRIISTSTDGSLKIWTWQDGKVQQTLNGHKGIVCAVAVLDEDQIVSASDDRTLKVWNLTTGETVQTLIGHTDSLTSVLMFDAHLIISTSVDSTLKVWNLKTGETNSVPSDQSQTGHQNYITDLVMLDDQTLVSASDDCSIKVWNIDTGAVIHNLTEHTHVVNAIAAIDAKHFVSASNDKALKVWDLDPHGVKFIDLLGHKKGITSVTMLDQNHFISFSYEGILKFWDLLTDKSEQVHIGHTGTVKAMIALDKDSIAMACSTPAIQIWNITTKEIVSTLSGHTSSVNDIAIYNSQYIISASVDQTLKIWELETRQPIRTLTGHNGSVNSLYVIENQHIVSASSDHTLKIWNCETGKEISSLELDNSLGCVVVAKQGTRTLVMVGDVAGALYCLELVEPKGGQGDKVTR